MRCESELADGQPRLVRISPNAALEEGVVDYTMTCHSGGTLDIYIEPVLPKPHILILGPANHENVSEARTPANRRNASEAKIRANRENAQKSTGPKTPRGKRNSSRNAVKHGILAVEVVSDCEDEAQFNRLVNQLCDDYSPEGAREYIQIERIAASLWRLSRALAYRAGRLTKVTMPPTLTGRFGTRITPNERSNGPPKSWSGCNVHARPASLKVEVHRVRWLTDLRGKKQSQNPEITKRSQ